MICVCSGVFSHRISLTSGRLVNDVHLGEEGSGDEDLHGGGDEELDDQQDDGRRTLLGDAAVTVSDGGLSLQGEEKSPRQRLHLHHTHTVVC